MDLARRLNPAEARRIVDIGCGPGNSTRVLKDVLPQAEILGIDNSENMIRKAREKHPELEFQRLDADKELERLADDWDAIFSNACLQWIPDHRTLIPRLMSRLRPGGMLAVQMPINGQETLYRIIEEVSADPKWRLDAVKRETNGTLEPADYFDLLSGISERFDLWETTYYHAMPDHEALLEWVKGTRLRPYLEALGEERGAAFEAEILARAREAYPVQANGEIIFRFRRLFFIAVRPEA